MLNKFQRRKEKTKSIALERIEELIKQADLASSKRPERAKEYVKLARRISSRSKTKIPKELKRRFCKHCSSFFRIGSNARIRLNKGKKSYFCMSCNKFTRVPYK